MRDATRPEEVSGGKYRGRTEGLRSAVVPVEDDKWGNKVMQLSTGSLRGFSPPCLRSVVLNILSLFMSILSYMFPRHVDVVGVSMEKGQNDDKLQRIEIPLLQSSRPTLVKRVTFSSRAADNSDAAKFRSTFPSRRPSKTRLKLQYFRQAGDGRPLQLSEPQGRMGNGEFDQTSHANHKEMASGQMQIHLFVCAE